MDKNQGMPGPMLSGESLTKEWGDEVAKQLRETMAEKITRLEAEKAELLEVLLLAKEVIKNECGMLSRIAKIKLEWGIICAAIAKAKGE